jgi:hypothetical protein
MFVLNLHGVVCGVLSAFRLEFYFPCSSSALRYLEDTGHQQQALAFVKCTGKLNDASYAFKLEFALSSCD